MKKTFRSLLSFVAVAALCISCNSEDSAKEASKTGPTETEQAATDVTEDTTQTDENLQKIKLPEGFRINYYARDVDNARSMALSPSGVLYVGTREEDRVYAVVDSNKDGKADEVVVIASGLDSPNGVALKDGDLYVAEISRVIRFRDIDNTFRKQPKPEVINDKFPTDKHHGWKYIAFGPDDKLYVPVGAPCNICKEDNPIYASIARMNADGSGLEVFAEGVRNTVGFTWHPETKELWFTDNGRDMMGDNIPPCELNSAPKKGLHFGYPYCHGGTIADPEFGKQRKCDEFTKPVQNLGAHVAPLGVKFYTGNMFPAKYKNQVFIAEHGSWNRSKKSGYRLMLVTLEGNKATSYEPFAEGWLQGEDDWGRPVDVIVMQDGSLLVSDDKNDAIYRISYAG